MKKILIFFIAILMTAILCSCEAASESPATTDGSEASDQVSSLVLYEEDATVGTGEKEVMLTVKAADKAYNFTILTDKETLGEALIESGLVGGEKGPYGLYITSVNGIQAIYELDNSYWALSVDGESSALGADSVKIEEGRVYALVYTIM